MALDPEFGVLAQRIYPRVLKAIRIQLPLGTTNTIPNENETAFTLNGHFGPDRPGPGPAGRIL